MPYSYVVADLVNQWTSAGVPAGRPGITSDIFRSNSGHMPLAGGTLLSSDYQCALVCKSLHVVTVDNLIIRRIGKILSLLVCQIRSPLRILYTAVTTVPT